MEGGYLQNIYQYRELVILSSIKTGKCFSRTYIQMVYL